MTYRISTSRSELNLLPAFFFIVGSVAVLVLCQFHPLPLMLVLPGVVVALTCLAGIVAGLVGRHWLVGMAFSLAASSIIANLYFLSIALQSSIGSYKNVSAFQFMQLVPIVVFVSSIPALLMRFLRSWRLVVDSTPLSPRSIEYLFLVTTFVALMIAMAINASSNEDFPRTVILLGGIGAFTVTIFLPLVRNSLSDSRIAKNLSHSDLGYFLIVGIPAVLLVAFPAGSRAIGFGVLYCSFAVCLKAGIYCLDLTGLKFRNQQMDIEAQDYAIADSSDSSKLIAHAQGPLIDDSSSEESSSDLIFSNDRAESNKSNRDLSVVHGRWALASIALVVVALSILRILFAKS